MDILNSKVEMLNKKGEVLIKANTPYFPVRTENILGRKYLIYQSELENEEILIPINNSQFK